MYSAKETLLLKSGSSLNGFAARFGKIICPIPSATQLRWIAVWMNLTGRGFRTILRISIAGKMHCSAGARIRIRKTTPACQWWMLRFGVLIAAAQRRHHSTGAIRVKLVLCAIKGVAVVAGLLPRSARSKEVICYAVESVILLSRTFFPAVAPVPVRADSGHMTI